MQIQAELQLYDFQKSKDNFTFIPYGLKAGLSKEAVKVHVLHGRKRSRTERKPPQSKEDGVLQGRTFQWNSKATNLPKTSVLNARLPEKGSDTFWVDENATKEMAASLGQKLLASHNSRRAQRLSMDDCQMLRNPFAEQMKEPFRAFPERRIGSMNYLVDHYLSRCGTSRFPRELLASYWQDTAIFKAFLAHAATLFELETGTQPPVSVEELMCDALQEIRVRLLNPIHGNTDGTTLAVALLANVEEGRTQRQNAAHHWRGLKQLLRLRGSFSSIRLHRDLHTMLLWREILTSNSYDFCFGHGIADQPELQHCNEHIVSFFDNFADQLSSDHCCDNKDDALRSLLATVANRRTARRCEWTSSMSRRSEIACLIYLAMCAISAGVSPESRRVMERVKDEVRERDRWGEVGPEELLFVILQESNLEHEWRCQQLWQLSRCVFLTRTLNATDWKTVRDLLSLFVGVDQSCDSKIEVLNAWRTLSTRLLLEDECHKDQRGSA